MPNQPETLEEMYPQPVPEYLSVELSSKTIKIVVHGPARAVATLLNNPFNSWVRAILSQEEKNKSRK